MSIDWVTVIAQIANFLVLVWLLKRFLYRPILDGIDAREAEITRRMAEAGEAEKKAQAAEATYLQQQKQLLSDQDAEHQNSHNVRRHDQRVQDTGVETVETLDRAVRQRRRRRQQQQGG